MLEKGHSPIVLHGIKTDEWPIFFEMQFKNDEAFAKRSHVLVCSSLDEAEQLYETLRSALPQTQVYFFPGLETSPYGGILSSELNLFKRFKILDLLTRKNEPLIVVCYFEALFLHLPPATFFKDKSFTLKREDIISPRELAQKLVELGYSSAITAEEPGTFAQRGEIFDIYPLSHPPVRLTYFDDLIEHIYKIDLKTQKTIREEDFSAGLRSWVMSMLFAQIFLVIRNS